MSADARADKRKSKSTNQVERFNESRLALQRAMEKDYRTDWEARRTVEDDSAAAQRAQEKDANATRLAALLEAAREQDGASCADTGESASKAKPTSIDRAHAKQASFLTEDIHAARVRATHPDQAPETPPEPMAPPPLVDRDPDAGSVSAGKAILRLLCVVILVGVAIYALVRPETGEEAESAANASVAVPDVALGPQSAPLESAPFESPSSESAPPSVAKSASAVETAPDTARDAVPDSETGPSTGAVADTATRDASQPMPAVLSTPSTAVAHAASEMPSAGASAAIKVSAPASEAAPVVRRATDTPPPPPPPPSPATRPTEAPAASQASDETGSKSTIGEETLRALSLVGPDAESLDGSAMRPAITNTEPAPAAKPHAETTASTERPAPEATGGNASRAERVSAKKPTVDRRPFFRRLGSTPVPNPFRPGAAEPPPAPPPFTYQYLEVE